MCSEKENMEVLDKLDLLPFISRDDTINDVRDKIQTAAELHRMFDDIIDLDCDLLQGSIFNWLNDYDLMNYFEQRYGTEFQEVTEFYVRRRGEEDKK